MLQFAYIASRKIEDLFIDRGLNMGSLVYDGHLIVPTDVKADDFVYGGDDARPQDEGHRGCECRGGACDHRLGWHSEGIGRRLNYAPNTFLQYTL